MKIWKVNISINDYADFLLKDRDNEALDEILNSGKYINKWPKVELLGSDLNKPFADCVKLWVGAMPLIFNKKAKDIIQKKYSDYIQFLPMIYEENNEIYYWANILNAMDCIDYEKSDLKISLGKYIMEVNKYVFKDIVKNQPIFKIYLDGIFDPVITFVNDEFKKLIEDNKLKGFKFTEVFDFNS